jgi:phenylalanyl-tRNA synthetase beta chain
VTVADADRCDRFSMIAMEGLDPTAPSPWWLRRRLAQASVRMNRMHNACLDRSMS